MAIEEVNAAPAFVVRSAELTMVASADRDQQGRIVAIRLMLNPDKLVGLDEHLLT